MLENLPLPKKRSRFGPKAISVSTIVKADPEKKVKHYQRLVDKARERKKAVDRIKKIDENKTAVVDIGTLEKAPKTVVEYINDKPILFKPHPGPQTDFLAATEREVFYGGARGGGKSYSLLVDPLRYCNEANARALIIRKTLKELRDLINHSLKLYKQAYPGAQWRDQEKEWKFPSGARIEFGYAETRQDALQYQGQAYTWIGIDELPQYSDESILNDLRGSLRSAYNIPLYLRATGNPGNIGSHWVKKLFIDPAPPNTPFTVTIKTPLGDRTITRRFIPAKLSDNPSLMQNDDYLIMLASLPEIQRKQWLEGNWDVSEGAAFPEFDSNIHVIEPFDIPRTWVRFRAADWGYSSPACCLWFAIDDDGILYVYRELYVKGMLADKFGEKVLELEKGENIRYGVLDESAWAKRGEPGPSIAERMLNCRWRPSGRGGRDTLTGSPRSRVHGKAEVHRRLLINEKTKKPNLFIFRNCINLINTLPSLPLDKHNLEDVDTNAEDHAYDALRYGCSSRPITGIMMQQVLASSIKKLKREAQVDPVFGY